MPLHARHLILLAAAVVLLGGKSVQAHGDRDRVVVLHPATACGGAIILHSPGFSLEVRRGQPCRGVIVQRHTRSWVVPPAHQRFHFAPRHNWTWAGPPHRSQRLHVAPRDKGFWGPPHRGQRLHVAPRHKGFSGGPAHRVPRIDGRWHRRD